MTVVNKYIVSGSGWNLFFFYLAVQSVVCIAAITLCRQLRLVRLEQFDVNRAKTWYPVSLLFVGMLYTGNMSLKYLTVPVYTIFKNLTIIVIAYGEVLWFNGRVTALALLSFGLIVMSSIVAALADIQSTIKGSGHTGNSTSTMLALNVGYMWMAFNVVCTAARLLVMRKLIKQTNDWDSMYYNNLLSIPVLILCSLLFEDWSRPNLARNFPPETRNGLLLGMVYSGLGGIFISYCSVWCLRVTSSTTFSMVGALNKLPIALSGLVFFGDPITMGSVSAIVIGFVSGIVYAWAKIQEREKTKNSLPTVEPPLRSDSQSIRETKFNDS